MIYLFINVNLFLLFNTLNLFTNIIFLFLFKHICIYSNIYAFIQTYMHLFKILFKSVKYFFEIQTNVHIYNIT
jgi:hypothetical protein